MYPVSKILKSIDYADKADATTLALWSIGFGYAPYRLINFYRYPMKPNIHQFPEDADAFSLLQYKIAVQQACLDGRPVVECRRTILGHRYAVEFGVPVEAPSDGEWAPCKKFPPVFNWAIYDYRIMAPKVVPTSRFFCFADGTLFGFTDDPESKRYCLEAKPDGTVVYLHLDGHVEPAPAWTLDRCVGHTKAGGSWKEFDGSMEIFRQKPAPKIAEGHNPAMLNHDQVEVALGWRLLAPEEIGQHDKDDKPGEIVHWLSTEHWSSGEGDHGWYPETTYRTKAAPGRFLPKPKVAEGHNPAKLTEDQIGVGFRTITVAENEALRPNGQSIPDLDFWLAGRWNDAGCGGLPLTYRIPVKLPADHLFIRLTTPKIADGHNPRGLTVDQVGLGYRTLTADEVKGPKQTGVQFWSVGDDRWRDSSMLTPEHCQLDTYRTSAKPGEYLPKPKLAPGEVCGRGPVVNVLKGYNPENLTAQQLEAHQGWRPLTAEEHEHLRSLNGNSLTRDQLPLQGSDLQYFADTNRWTPAQGGRTTYTYRTKRPAGWYTAAAEEARRIQRHVDNLFAKMNRDDAFRALADLQSVAPLFAPPGSGREALRKCVTALDVFDRQIAEGHNPLGLTNAEVGVTEGWRLLSTDEVKHRASQKDITRTTNIQNVFYDRSPGWSTAPCRGDMLESVYRTKLPAGHFLPRPKPTTVRGWLETLPAGYRERALRNLTNPGASSSSCLKFALSAAFIWSESPEGRAFWDQVYEWDKDSKANKLPALPKP